MKKEEAICFLGSMKVRDRVNITDPCYGHDHEVENLRPGNWIGVTELREEDTWGVRNCYLAIFHEHYNYEHEKFALTEEFGADAGVDSGQMSIYVDDVLNGLHVKTDFYDEICDITSNDSGGGALCTDGNVFGFVSQSGFGDGGYPIFMKLDDITGEVLALEVVFIPLKKDPRFPSAEDYEEDVDSGKKEDEDDNQ